MTLPTADSAVLFGVMKHIYPIIAAAIVGVASADPEAATLDQMLRDALFAEEVQRDLNQSEKLYRELVGRYAEQRDRAMVAQYRLAEVLRKAGKDELAAEAYQALLRDFPEAEVEGRDAREALSALGVKVEAVEGGAPVAVDSRVQELAALKQTSPDVFAKYSTLLEAIGSGNIHAVRFLLANGHDPHHELALRAAAMKGFREVFDELMLAGDAPPGAKLFQTYRLVLGNEKTDWFGEILKQDPTSRDVALLAAVEAGYLGGVKITVDVGGDLNQKVMIGLRSRDTRKYSPGMDNINVSLLGLALCLGDEEIVRSLHTAGARFLKREDLSQPSVFHLLASDGEAWYLRFRGQNIFLEEERSLAGLKLARELGADLRQVVTIEGQADLYPFHAWFERKRSEARRKIVPLFPNYTRNDLEFALAKLQDADVFVEMLKQGVEAGALTGDGASRLYDLLTKSDGFAESYRKAISRLRAEGVMPPDGWQERYFGKDAVVGDVYREIANQLLIPELLQKQEITVLATEHLGREIPVLQVIAKKEEGDEILELARELGNKLKGQHQSEVQFVHWTTDAAGTVTSVVIDPSKSVPTIKWGDVIEVTRDRKEEKRRRQNGVRSVSYNNLGENPELLELFRMQVDAKISLSFGDNEMKLHLSGKRLAFDANYPSLLPNVTAAQLYELIPLAGRPMGQDAKIRIQREGWVDIDLVPWSDEAQQFHFSNGDRIELVGELSDKSKTLQKDVKVIIEGKEGGLQLPILELGEVCDLGDDELTVTTNIAAPRMLEAVVSALDPLRCFQSRGSIFKTVQRSLRNDRNDLDFYRYRRAVKSLGMLPLAIPQVDFSDVRVVSRAGGERTLDLSSAIERGVDVKVEEIEKVNIQLKPGDVVFLKLKDSDNYGFTTREAEFFSKALDGNLLFVTDKGRVEQLKLNWQPPVYRETASGMVPLEPGAGSSSLLYRRAVSPQLDEASANSDLIRLERKDVEYLATKWHDSLLRRGDRIELKN